MHQSQLRDWAKKFAEDPQHAFPGHGKMKPDSWRWRGSSAKWPRLRAERDILKKAMAYFAKELGEVRLHREAPRDLANDGDVRGARCLAWRVLRLDEPSRERRAKADASSSFNAHELRAERQDLWQPARVARSLAGASLRSPSRGAIDAIAASAEPSKEASSADRPGIRPSIRSLRTCSTGASKRARRTNAGSQTLRTSGQRRAGCTGPSSDLFSRRVVGWSMSSQMNAELVTEALVMAIWWRGKPAMLAASLGPGQPVHAASSSSG